MNIHSYQTILDLIDIDGIIVVDTWSEAFDLIDERQPLIDYIVWTLLSDEKKIEFVPCDIPFDLILAETEPKIVDGKIVEKGRAIAVDIRK